MVHLQQKLRLVSLVKYPPGAIRSSFNVFTCSLEGKFYDAVVQMGKDVVTFLSWAAEPEMEERKLVCLHSSMSQ